MFFSRYDFRAFDEGFGDNAVEIRRSEVPAPADAIDIFPAPGIRLREKDVIAFKLLRDGTSVGFARR